MSHPLNVQRAESKVYQLALAHQIGFHIPETIITNQPGAIRRFYDVCGGDIIAKPLRRGYFDYGDKQTCVFTETISKDDLIDEEGLRLAPVIYQQCIAKECDIRVTVVGTEIYTAAIHSQSVPSAVTDWRKSETDDLPHSRHDLPDNVSSLCLQLLNEMNLSFGAIDLVLTSGGEYYFLEVNPNGQWLWIEDRLGFPISLSIARWLVEHVG